MSDKSASWKIGTYARIRPPRKGSQRSYSTQRGNTSSITFPFPASPDTRSNLKQREELEFNFSRVFDPLTTQDSIYEQVCLDIVHGAIEGYNGTILAYGQTGSGKTFTITGGECYQDRGIIPRVITTLFEEFESRPNMNYRCYISYLEIYNENIYDLLDRAHMDKPIEEWTRIQIKLSDDDEDDAHFRNLGVYEANSEEEALNLLFLGNANRVTSDTPMNMASSRSHSIFTFMMEARQSGSEMVLYSKLHVVDLAGSERVYKREGSERMRSEGRFINLSLHHLEQVILALQAKPIVSKRGQKKPHVPYRNSMLTSVLRGSLGGNCKSVFIGTLNPEPEFVDESISTCRFMQRCSEVAVEVRANEVPDTEALVEILKKDNESLKREHQMIHSKWTEQLELSAELQKKLAAMHPTCTKELNASEHEVCEELVERFLVAEWGSDQQTEALTSIQTLGINHAVHCLTSVKQSLIFASTTAAEVQDLLNTQNERMLELEARLIEQKQDAEALRKTIAMLTEQLNVQQTAQSPPKPERIHPLPPPPVVDVPEQQPQKRVSNSSAINKGSASDAIKRRMELLKQGSIFIKHGRQGNPHPRFVWCSSDLQYLSYRSVGGSPSPAIQIPTSSIGSLVLGQSTKVFQRRGDPSRAGYCFSLIYDDAKRSLDLEVDDGENTERNKQKCTDWIDAFQFLIKWKTSQRNLKPVK